MHKLFKKKATASANKKSYPDNRNYFTLAEEISS